MGLRSRIVALGGTVAVAALLGAAASASAAFPNFSDCPLPSGSVGTCLDIQSQSGNIVIKGFSVPLDHSLEIRGGLNFNNDGSTTFLAPAGTNGFFAQPVDVPGGLLGINLPLSANKVTATAQLAGPASSIQPDLQTLNMALPIKLRLSNPLLTTGCTIGTDSNPVHLNLITGTTSPPPPNTPISGHVGTPSNNGSYTLVTGNLNVDNSFSVPGASGCGLLGLTNVAINVKLKLPSAGGNNTMQIDNDLAIEAP